MKWAHLSLFSATILSSLLISSQANAYRDYRVYSYDGMAMEAVPVARGSSCNCCYKTQSYKKRCCCQRTAYHVCTKYVYHITPMHRDVYCSEWGTGYRSGAGWVVYPIRYDTAYFIR